MNSKNTTFAATNKNANTNKNASPVASEVHDICGYCGADNGPIGKDGRGISRSGWYCYVCSGN